MSPQDHEHRYSAPETALTALRAHRGPLLIDLDETLYLRNSTEDFLDCARPGLLALLLLRLLDLLAPWRWSGGIDTRDVWRVNAVRWLLPWTQRRWRRRVPALAAAHGNHALIQALRQQPQLPIIVTNGFDPLVRPLVAALGFGRCRVVAAGLRRCADRRDGKLARAQRVLGAPIIAAALVLTDSTDDQALLDACALPLLTRWPQAHCRPALGDVYLPGQYLSRVKRPGERYIVRGIAQEDFAFWVLASIGLASLPLTHVAGLACLCLSFWTIYEMGYVDNDRIGARYEQQPKLSAAFHQAAVATPAVQPWIWAAASGALAILLLRLPAAPSWTDALAWAAVLLGSFGWFRLYNRLDKRSRVWLFGGLQLARSAAFVVLVPITAAGAAALGAHVMSRWMPYFLYRMSGSGWPDTPFTIARLLLFLMLCLLLSAVAGIQVLLHWSTAALLLWALFRARREIVQALQSATRIDRTAT